MASDQTASKQSDLGPYCLKYIVHIKISNECKIFYKTYFACSRINVWFPKMCKQTLQALIRLLLARSILYILKKTSQWISSFEHPKYNNSLIWTYACNQRNLYAICQKYRVILIVWLTPAPTPLRIVLILTNSADPEEIPPYAVFH